MTKMYPPVILLIIGSLTFAAQARPPATYEGMRLFVTYCQLCHGPEGRGDGPLAKRMNIQPSDLKTTVRVRSDLILKKIISGEGRQTITGRDRHNLISDVMPQWKDVLTDQQINALIAYLRYLVTAKHKLIGNPEMGFELYQKYCHVCHGEDGSGDGILTTLIAMEPSDHSNPVEMNALSNKRLINSITNGAGEFMPAWQGILSAAEIESLVGYIRLLSQ